MKRRERDVEASRRCLAGAILHCHALNVNEDGAVYSWSKTQHGFHISIGVRYFYDTRISGAGEVKREMRADLTVWWFANPKI